MFYYSLVYIKIFEIKNKTEFNLATGIINDVFLSLIT